MQEMLDDCINGEEILKWINHQGPGLCKQFCLIKWNFLCLLFFSKQKFKETDMTNLPCIICFIIFGNTDVEFSAWN